MSFGKLPNVRESQFPHLQNEDGEIYARELQAETMLKSWGAWVAQ